MSLGTWVAIGALGGVGAVLRHLAGRGPLSILALNLAGAFALGLVGTDEPAVAVGLLGATTTFSTWMAHLRGLPRRQAVALAAAALLLGLLAVWTGRELS